MKMIRLIVAEKSKTKIYKQELKPSQDKPMQIEEFAYLTQCWKKTCLKNMKTVFCIGHLIVINWILLK